MKGTISVVDILNLYLFIPKLQNPCQYYFTTIINKLRYYLRVSGKFEQYNNIY